MPRHPNPNPSPHPDTASFTLAIGRAVYRLRKERGLSRKKLAHASGISNWTFEALESGRGTSRTYVGSPRAETLRCIASGLGIRASELLAVAERLQDESGVEAAE